MCPPASLSIPSTTSPSPSPSTSSVPPPPPFIPSSPLALAAYTLAATHLPPPILHHSLRVFLYALHFHTVPTTLSTLPYPSPISPSPLNTTHLFIACILHDLGASTHTTQFNDSQRFEVCGADAAVALMSTPEFAAESTETERLNVWAAIALHTSPGIVERYSTLTRHVRLAVLSDFGRGDLVTEKMKQEVEREWPRGEIERVLGSAVVEQVMGKEDDGKRLLKAPNVSWPWALVKSHQEDAEKGVVPEGGVNRAF